MAKRFISTELFDDDWFMELSVPAKLLWVYFITKCDHAGMIKYNQKLCKFQTGINSLDTVIKELSKRLVRVDQELFFIPKFLIFQYPGFPKSKAPQQQGAIKLLERYGLYSNGLLTVSEEFETVCEELPNSIVNVNGNGKGEIKVPEFSEFHEYAKTLKPYKVELDYSLKSKYDSWVGAEWHDGYGKKIKDWKGKLRNTILHLVPEKKEYTAPEMKVGKI